MKRSNKTWLLALVAVPALAGAGLTVSHFLPGRQSEVVYRTAAVERGTLTATISATGTIEPEEVIDVGAQVAAFIKNFGPDPRDPKKSIDYGSPVHKGTLLAQLDDSLFKTRVEQAQAAVDEAKAQLEQAGANERKAEADLHQLQARQTQTQREWERAQSLRLSRTIADSDYDVARANYESADASVRVGQAAILQARAARVQSEKTVNRTAAALHEAEVNLGYTQIRSPVEGVIVDRRVNVGQTVVAGLNAPSLFLIAKDLKRLQVWAAVNEADIGTIRAGQLVRFTVDAYPRDVFTGQVDQIRLNANMTQNVVTYTVVVSTTNYDGRLLPYMTANLQFHVAEHSGALLVPNAALRWRPQPDQVAPEAREAFAKGQKRRRAGAGSDAPDRGLVWVPEGDFVRPVRVRLGLTDGAVTEVVDGGLEAGAAVVTGESRRASNDGTENPFTPKLFGGKKQG